MNEHVLTVNCANSTDIKRLLKNSLLNSNLRGIRPIVLLSNQPHLFTLIKRRFHLRAILKLLKFLNYITCRLKYQLVQVTGAECIYFII
jgi:hypothetical protein